MNFVIDEASDTGKGANTVGSLLDFSHHGLGEATASLHADNCSGQNKNNTMVQYLMWRVLTGLHQTISLHFMITGHTKFSPDACFGLIKRKFCKTAVSSLDDLARVVDESAACNICQLVGSQDGSTIVPSRDWAGFLSSHYRRLDGIKQYHHFRFERDHPGVVFLKKTATAEEEQRCLLRGVWSPSPVEKPPSITPAGLSLSNGASTCMTRFMSTVGKMCKTSCVRIQTFLFMSDRTQDQSRHRQSVHGSDSTLSLPFFFLTGFS